MALVCGHAGASIEQVMMMRNTLSRLRLMFAIATAFALAAPLAASAAELSAAGLWQKTEDGKPEGWFLVIERNGVYEGMIARMFSAPDEPPS